MFVLGCFYFGAASQKPDAKSSTRPLSPANPTATAHSQQPTAVQHMLKQRRAPVGRRGAGIRRRRWHNARHIGESWSVPGVAFVR
eukprot:scaffold9098_cov124-Isochrysis_galbana.AAC.8